MNLVGQIFFQEFYESPLSINFQAQPPRYHVYRVLQQSEDYVECVQLLHPETGKLWSELPTNGVEVRQGVLGYFTPLRSFLENCIHLLGIEYSVDKNS